MTPEQIDRVKDLLSEALSLPEEKRQAYLDEACSDDPVVRREISSLLTQEGLETPILDQPVFNLLHGETRDAPPPIALEAGQRIGAYQIVKILDEGGMGCVALARRTDDFHKDVALKVIRPDTVSEDTLRRFDNERQLLALLDHPNVASILDGGTTDDGRPFFVMEHVEGLPLDRYCVERNLGLKQRLELFQQICAAVQMAHQSLIVHRDLKPSNILVTEAGVPKLLDFGIAKRLDAETAATKTQGAVPLTLRYASPEQVDPRPERPITTASDIYSLGIILFQLLTDQLPYAVDGESLAALVRAICQDPPPLPSAVVDRARARRLTGDLDSIVAKALRKDPRARYASVERLAGDVQRHLSGRPVLARQGNFAYRTMKLVRRHRVKLAVATALMLVTLSGAASSTALWRKAATEQKRSEKVLEFLQDLFKKATPDNSQGEELSALEILAQGERDVDELEDPLSRAKLLDTIGDVYSSLEMHDRALVPRQRSLQILRQRYPGAHPHLAKAINDLASTYYNQNRFEQAEKLYREALAMKRWLKRSLFAWKLSPKELDVTKSMGNLATIVLSRLDYREAESLYRQVLDLRLEIYGAEDEDVATSQRNLAHLLYTVGQQDEAEELARRSLEIRLENYGHEHTQTAKARFALARVLHAQDRGREAEQQYREALAIRRRLLGDDSPSTARVQVALAALLEERGANAESEELLDAALAVLVIDLDPPTAELAEAHSVLGALRGAQGRSDEAHELLTESWRRLVELEGEVATRARQARRRLDSFRHAAEGPEK